VVRADSVTSVQCDAMRVHELIYSTDRQDARSMQSMGTAPREKIVSCNARWLYVWLSVVNATMVQSQDKLWGNGLVSVNFSHV